MNTYKPEESAVVLVNLGSPQAPTPSALRVYLKEFLSDPRVIDLPAWKWWPILHGVILNIRPRRSAALYAKIWTANGAPLIQITQAQTQALQKLLAERAFTPRLAFAMRYGEPSLSHVWKNLCDVGVKRLIVVPLYPQNASPSTASVYDGLFSALKKHRYVPELHIINGYHAHPLYIQALADSIRVFQAEHGIPDRLLFSFHGLPQRYIDDGDAYLEQVQETVALLKRALNLNERQCEIVFQSRFGKEPWLQPYALERIRTLAQQGVRHLQVICPGFAVDCLETLEEIAITNHQFFLENGGERYEYIPALNNQTAHIKLLAALVQPYLDPLE